ncbi:hypothetical protein LXL04_031798 [Taraxacum kok-saghyz]
MRFWGSGTNLNRPKRVIIGRVYEKFKPIFEWGEEEDDHHSLHIYLPGFRKEFMKVTTENPNILRICGERFVAGNKWDWFKEDFTLPKTCKKSAIRAKLDGGILIITLPNKITNASSTTAKFPGDPLKTAKQTKDSANTSSSTLNATLPTQPPGVNSNGTFLNRNKEKGPITERTRETKRGSGSKIKERLEGYYMLMVKRLAMGMVGVKEGRIVVVNMVAVLVAVLVTAGLVFMLRTPLRPPQVNEFNLATYDQ